MKRLILGLIALMPNIALAAPGDRVIRNPNQDGNLSICVNDGGVETCPFVVDGASGKVATTNFDSPLILDATTGAAAIRLSGDGTTSGDAVTQYRDGTSTRFIVGLDATDDSWQIAGSSGLGSDPKLSMASSGDVRFYDSVAVGGTIDANVKLRVIKDAGQNNAIYILRPASDTQATKPHIVLQSQSAGSTDGDSFILYGTQNINWSVGVENTTNEFRVTRDVVIDSDGTGTQPAQTKMRIDSNGNTEFYNTVKVGVGTAAAAGYSLEVLGTSFNGIVFNRTNGAADQKLWRLIDGGGTIRLDTRTDANAAGETAWEVTRSGTAISAVSFPNGSISTGTPAQTVNTATALYVSDGYFVPGYEEDVNSGNLEIVSSELPVTSHLEIRDLDGIHRLHGLTGGNRGSTITLVNRNNAGNRALQIVSNSGTESTAANRILVPGGQNWFLEPGGAMQFSYVEDPLATGAFRWIPTSIPAEMGALVPTCSNLTNIATCTPQGSYEFAQMGSKTFFGFRVDVTPTSGANVATTFSMPLANPNDIFDNNTRAFGTCTAIPSGATEVKSARITSDGATDKLFIYFIAETTNPYQFWCHGFYRIFRD